MPDTTTVRQVIAVDPDGVPVALQDAAGDQLDGVLYGAARAGGAVALIVTELDHFSRQPTGPPTRGQLRALADALDNDPNDPHLLHGSRRWWQEEAARLRASAEHAERARAEAVEIAQGLRDALDRERRLLAATQAGLARQVDRVVELAGQLGVARRKLAVLKYGPGALNLARAAVQVQERRRARAIAKGAAAAGLVAGVLIGHSR